MHDPQLKINQEFYKHIGTYINPPPFINIDKPTVYTILQYNMENQNGDKKTSKAIRLTVWNLQGNIDVYRPECVNCTISI